MEQCRSCNAQVIWVRMFKSGKPGKMAPVDAAPVKMVQVKNEEMAPSLTGEVIEVYTPHFATCPDAAAWRGGGR